MSRQVAVRPNLNCTGTFFILRASKRYILAIKLYPMLTLFLTIMREHSPRTKWTQWEAEAAIISCEPCTNVKKVATQERALTWIRSWLYYVLPSFLWLPAHHVEKEETICKRNKFRAKSTRLWLLAVDRQLIIDVNNWGFYASNFLLT